MEFIADYDLKIQYHPGKANVVADALTFKGESSEPLRFQAVNQAGFIHRIREAQFNDDKIKKIVERIEDPEDEDTSEYQIAEDGTFLVHGRITVTEGDGLREEILRIAHQSTLSIHPGSTKIYKDVRKYYHWPGMKRAVAKWVAQCQTCQQIKAEHRVPGGLLQSLPIPQ
ncbi:unnamed protein product [Microthlaspi erraticum]|uniref:Integrase zinc-binding domain-containing protein n=1 Tax=Microthlaspi erraticum TaxID=1685480 RepID=A0A6D2I295_9BRAS|nr:unnamed protein product [Microthlaspi erraticum]